jgi:hypothetical protein
MEVIYLIGTVLAVDSIKFLKLSFMEVVMDRTARLKQIGNARTWLDDYLEESIEEAQATEQQGRKSPAVTANSETVYEE